MPIKSAEYDERVAAIHALGELGQSCPGKFAPYFQQAYKILDNHYQFFYDNVRIEVCYCYTNLTLGYVKLHNNGVLPTFEKGLPCVKRLTPAIE